MESKKQTHDESSDSSDSIRSKQEESRTCLISADEGNASDDSDDNVSDEGDLCDDKIESSFCVPYHLETEKSVSLDNIYILKMCGTKTINPKIAVALSDKTCAVYDIERLVKITDLRRHTATITNIKFSPIDENLVYTSSLDGHLNLWDIRTDNNCAKVFKDDTNGANKCKPLTSFDVSHNNRYLSAGTELIGGDAFILFWDIRTSNILGGYWESHTDDITHVAFHPTTEKIIATGSTDGLINVFDIGLECEDDALQQCLNTEGSVEKIGWLKQNQNTDALSCITHTEHLQLWELDGATPYFALDRRKLTHAMHRNPCNNCYIVDVHPAGDELMIVAGSSGGGGECLRTMKVMETTIQPMSRLTGNRQIVRSSWYDHTGGVNRCSRLSAVDFIGRFNLAEKAGPAYLAKMKNGLLLTGGERGLLSVWKPGAGAGDPSPTMKINSDIKHQTKSFHKAKPY